MSRIPHQTLRERVASEIRMKIYNQELLPGMRIVEQNLAAEFGVSRAPIREALRQLEQEGLVAYTRNAGCSVRSLSPEELYEVYLLRAHYEMLAVQLSDGHFSPEELDEMESILDEMLLLDGSDMHALLVLDHRLHEIIIQKADLPRLHRSWLDLSYGNIVAGLNDSASRTGRALRQHSIHRTLVDMCRTGDADAICRALQSHYMRPIQKLMNDRGIDTSRYRFTD